jgi:hypothetical protein
MGIVSGISPPHLETSLSLFLMSQNTLKSAGISADKHS